MKTEPAKPLLAAIIPTFNRSDTLTRCLDSIFAQTLRPDEIIVVDDGSTDGSTQNLEKEYPGLRLIIQRHSGVSRARNTGIETAQSSWIAFIDSDDVWLPQKCAKQIDALSQNPGVLVCHTEEAWIFRGTPKTVPKDYRKSGGRIFLNCLPRCAISPSTAIIDRNLLVSLGGFDESLPACEDYDLWLRITAHHPVLLVDEPLIEKHGGHPDQLSNQIGLDEYRIKALDKLLASEVRLKPEYREQAIAMLLEKCAIHAKGLEKGGNSEEASLYRSIANQFQQSGS